MNLAIADLDTSIELDREALLQIVGAWKHKYTSVYTGSWKNGRSRYYHTYKKTGFLGLGGTKKFLVRRTHQTRQQARYRISERRA